MPDILQMARCLGLAAMMRAAYETDQAYMNPRSGEGNPGPTKEEALRVQRFLSFPAEAQEKAIAYLENLQRYLGKGE